MTQERPVIRVGLIKAIPRKWDVEANWTTFCRLATDATKGRAQIICTPECFLDGYAVTDKEGWTNERFVSIAQSLEGDNYVRKAMGFALEHRVHIVLGFTELA